MSSPHLLSKGKRIMNKSKEISLVSLINRKSKCKFTRSCGLFSNMSYTCTHTGGSYCGKYRKLSNSLEESFTTLTKKHLIEVPQ